MSGLEFKRFMAVAVKYVCTRFWVSDKDKNSAAIIAAI